MPLALRLLALLLRLSLLRISWLLLLSARARRWVWSFPLGLVAFASLARAALWVLA
ncbi:hypothetical protein [Bosea sp. Tri-44]|uniref:hypothetical protein n=1 Tax=Bosea sp. Tri-44 TaxID=1972137 RepID=UPI0013E90AED|nr:hypothetical protein [Bosea sp. Tri-44]